MDAFISHSPEDREIAGRLAHALVDRGLSTRLDDSEIGRGVLLGPDVQRAILDCRVLVLLWSSAAVASRRVNSEWLMALHEDRSILPCVLDSTPLPHCLKHSALLDLSRDVDPTAERLAHAIRALGRGATSPAPLLRSEYPELQQAIAALAGGQHALTGQLSGGELGMAAELQRTLDTLMEQARARWPLDPAVTSLEGHHLKNAYMLKHWDAVQAGRAVPDGLLRQAEQRFFESLSVDPHDPAALNGLGGILMLQRDLDAAGFFIRAAIRAARRKGLADYPAALHERALVQRRGAITGSVPGRVFAAPVAHRLREAALAGIVPEPHAVRSPPAAQGRPVPAPQEPTVAEARSPAPMSPPPRDAVPAERMRAWGSGIALRLALAAAFVGAAAGAVRWLVGCVLDPLPEPVVPPDVVECTVFSPSAAPPGASLLVQAFLHLPEAADDARAIALELDTEARRRAFRTLESAITRGSRVDLELRAPGLEIDDPVASLVWRGRSEAAQFGVRIPADARPGSVIATLDLSLDAVPVGHLKFKLEVSAAASVAEPSEPQGERSARYRAAFVSYASADRNQVLERVQMLSLVGISYFQDLLALEPGDRWSRRIELGIDDCDLFLLFWSSRAKSSEWVRREVRHALTRKAGDDLSPPEIRPVILEGPPIVEPWEELADLHFNDRILYFLRPPSE